MTINHKNDKKNYRGKCFSFPVTSYGPEKFFLQYGEIKHLVLRLLICLAMTLTEHILQSGDLIYVSFQTLK